MLSTFTDIDGKCLGKANPSSCDSRLTVESRRMEFGFLVIANASVSIFLGFNYGKSAPLWRSSRFNSPMSIRTVNPPASMSSQELHDDGRRHLARGVV